METMGHSKKCPDLKTYYKRETSTCEFCSLRPGFEVTDNCGLDDVGGRHEFHFRECKANFTFNDGSGAYCKNCSSCPPGENIWSPCSTTADTTCQPSGSTTAVPVPVTVSMDGRKYTSMIPTSTFLSNSKKSLTDKQSGSKNDYVGLQWTVPLVILISIMVAGICAFLIYKKRKRGQKTVLSYSRRSSYINAGFSPLSALPGNNDLEHILSPNILSAPLQTVLDNLDVLEELVILLDPESQGVKNTKHLASHCSFTATWITYTYSMKESKSPLKAVLEGVTSRNPDWTVGHLAKLLRHMERNDAIAVLSKLGLNVIQV
ncbi:IGF-like family receptor 1 isoform X2 [Sebastes umbrosus]|uniref:IGF-like family receptor 1 isoform X2 n=1 Tax=Sebastes umbrosus TaxID=72105 RepID=UPI00189DEB5F|nr:IGF-like family receptor 1 isoform X2 [Sebastes umbrosus]